MAQAQVVSLAEGEDLAVESVGFGMAIRMTRHEGATASLAALLAQLDWLLSTGGWRTHVLRHNGTDWEQCDRPRQRGHTCGARGPEGFQFRFYADKGAQPTPQQVCDIVSRFSTQLAAVLA